MRTTATHGERETERRRVRLWLDEHLITEWIGDLHDSALFEAVARQQFGDLSVTNELARTSAL